MDHETNTTEKLDYVNISTRMRQYPDDVFCDDILVVGTGYMSCVVTSQNGFDEDISNFLQVTLESRIFLHAVLVCGILMPLAERYW